MKCIIVSQSSVGCSRARVCQIGPVLLFMMDVNININIYRETCISVVLDQKKSDKQRLGKESTVEHPEQCIVFIIKSLPERHLYHSIH